MRSSPPAAVPAPAIRLVTNTLFVFAGDTMVRLGNGLLYVLVGRQLGPAPAGSYQLGLTYALLLSSIAFWGLDQILTREVARRPEVAPRYFANFLSLRLLLPLLLYAGLAASLTMSPYPAGTRTVILLLGLTILSENVSNLCGALFMAHERMRLYSLVNLVAALPRFVGGAAVLFLTGELIPLVAVTTATGFLAMFLNLAVARRFGVPLRPRLEPEFWRAQLRVASPFVMIVIFYQVEVQLDTVLISLFHPVERVGHYGAVILMMSGLMLIPNAIRSSLYPLLARLVTGSAGPLLALVHRAQRTLLLVTLPLALLLALVAPLLVTGIFGASFAPAARPFQLIIWSFVLFSVNMPLARLMVAAGQQGTIARYLATSMTINVAANLLLVPAFGPAGAGLARTLSVGSYFLLTTRWTRAHYPGYAPLERLWRPLAAGAAAAGVALLLLPIGPLPAAAAAALLYLAVGAGLGLFERRDLALAAATLRALRPRARGEE